MLKQSLTAGLSVLVLLASLAGFAKLATAQVNSDPNPEQNAYRVGFAETADGVKVSLGKDEFTQLWTQSNSKPVLYPIYAPGQIGMTRNWPMVKGHREPQDHPHHKSLWLGHIINGVDFWTEAEGNVLVTGVKQNPDKGALTVTSDWVRTEGKQKICSDETVYSFGGNESLRWIDVSISFHASNGELHFEDTKEGTFAVRTHPNLQLTPAQELGAQAPSGTARNSAGIEGKQIWGKKAKWVVYQGAIDGSDVALAMFDHPANLNHPTTWHARDYGLVAANPFGLHEFLNQAPGAGAVKVAPGERLALRYRALFIGGKPTNETIEQWYTDFANDR